MKLRLLMLSVLLGLALVCVPAIAFANGNGDVTIRVNGIASGVPDPGFMGWIMPGMTSQVEIWIRNDAPLFGMSMAFALNITGLDYYIEPYQFIPPGQPWVAEVGTAVGKFDPNGLQVTFDSVSNIFVIQGAAVSSPLPVHPTSTLCYTFRVHGLCGSSDSGSFHIDNIFVAPNGTWVFDDGTPYPPTFCAMPNTSITVPDAPAVVFMAGMLPAIFPVFTTVPNSTETAGRCSGFEFTFAAVDLNTPVFPLEFSANVGEINPTTGQYALSPGPTCLSTEVTALVTNAVCLSVQYTFTVNWVETPPIFTNCPIVTAYVDTNDVYEYPFAVYDPDPCDSVSYSVEAHGNPHGECSIDPAGKLTFTPTAEDFERFFVFDVLAQSACSAVDSCQIHLAVLRSTCGDANGDMVLDISDVVSLITYIFQGGLPPNPPSNGDVDCSGGVDISDVVYIVTHIFSDGPGPCDGCK